MATTPTTPEPLIAAAPKEPTPLDPPLVYYNKKWRVPPLVVHTQEEADALDRTEWTPNPPAALPKEEFPKIFYNINVPPQIIDNADDEKALSGDWREFDISESLIQAAQAKIDAAKK